MEKWTTTLREPANLSRWDLRNVANKFMENIIEQVLQEVNQTPRCCLNPIGVDTRIKDIELLLENECVDEVHMVGIYGIGGIGKTTLAKQLNISAIQFVVASFQMSDHKLQHLMVYSS